MIIIRKNINNETFKSLETFKSFINEKYGLNRDDYFISNCNGKLFNNDSDFNYLTESEKLYIQPRLRGGKVLKPIIKPINDIVSGLGDIAKFFVLLYKAVVFLIKMAIWLIQFTIWFVLDFLNPLNFISDFIDNILRITRLVMIGAADMILGVVKKAFNAVFTKLFGGSIFGWDQSSYDRKKKRVWGDGTTSGGGKDCKDDEKDDPNSTCYEGDKCYETPPGKIPFTIIIATILCPPIGVFMQYGLSYWINILICGILTLALYFPGLIYALVMLYC